METLIARLAKNEVFSKVKQDDLEFLTQNSIHRTLEDGEYLSHQGDDWPKVLFVESGEISWALISPAGKEKILFTIKPGEDFWAHSIFDGKQMPASLYAIGNTKIHLWSKNEILPVIQRNPEAIWAVTCRLIGVMRHAREIIYGLAFQPVSARLSQLILDRFHDSDDPLAERDLTLDQIAAMISSTPQVVCRVMYQFQEAGLVELSRATIKLLDPKGLEKISEGH
ncbi:MAG: Crp/Fnr family transcriptional regulator [Anaerolineales bacterium]|nr:Crp/Fnr family transcriptional regulator [Anaerolineales bacterium]